ncbi:MAG: phosphotransferase family protein [Myxococcota bacterium]
MGDASADLDARVAAMLARQVEGFRSLRSLERLSGGASQATYRVVAQTDGGEQTFALRRAVARDGTSFSTTPGPATEAHLMRAAREAGVPEPRVHHVLEDADDLGEGFLMEWLAGETLGAKIARAPELEAVRPKLAFACGEILARIHGIDVEKTGLSDRLGTLPPEQYVRMTWEGYKRFETAQPMIDFTARWLLDHLPDAGDLRLVHNDFRNGNLMVGPGGIVAVLDWELAHIGDPMRDLGWLCTNSWRFGVREREVGGFGDRADLFRGYESVSGTPVDPGHVRFWEVFGSFWWSVGCLQMAQQYRTGADQSVERAAIGRRSSECQVDCVNLLIPGPVTVAGPVADRGDFEMPRADELLTSVREFLRGDVMEQTRGRSQFLARVASNSVDVVRRELALGPAARAAELAGLQALFDGSDDLSAQRWRLVHALREGKLPLDHPGLAEVLREAVVNQVAIDQPKYSGFRHAVSRSR